MMAEDGVWDSWEDFADSGDIDKHVEKGFTVPNNSAREQRNERFYSSDQVSKPSPIEKNSGQIKILPRPVICEDANSRTAYVPQLKILKRPDKKSEDELKKDRQSAQQPIKTLAQREAEYARARQRIMGVDGYMGEAKMNELRPENFKRHAKQGGKQPGGGGGAATNGEAVRRQPKGPNGTSKGFAR